MPFPATALPVKVEAAFGADLSLPMSNWTWTDITAPVRGLEGVKIQFGAQDETPQNNVPTSVTFSLNDPNNDFDIDNPVGRWYPNIQVNTPIRITYTSTSGTAFTRAVVFADDWQPDDNDGYSIVHVTASGLLRRLTRRNNQVLSTIRSYHQRTPPPVAYWPGEDQTGATGVSSAVGGDPMRLYGPDAPSFAAATPPSGSANLITSGQFTGMVGTVPVYPRTKAFTGTCLLKVPSVPGQIMPVIRWRTDKTIKEWRLAIDPGVSPDDFWIEAWDASGTRVLQTIGDFQAGSTHVGPYDRWLHIVFQVQQSGSNMSYNVRLVDCVDGTSSTISGSFAGTVGRVTNVDVPAGWDHSSWGWGHFAVYNYILTPPTDILTGFNGQNAANRLASVFADFDIDVTVVGTAGQSEAMGPRPVAGLKDVADECVAADGGIFYDGVDNGVVYRTNYNRYNLTSALTLLVARGDVKLPFKPVTDDQLRRNDWTVTRKNGASSRDTNDAHIARYGQYDETVTLNLESDGQTVHHAGWRVNLGTVEGKRYPIINLQPAHSKAIETAWLNTKLGDRITITGLQMFPTSADVVLAGYSETFFPDNYQVTMNCQPYRPWEVFEVEHTRLGRIDTDGSVLVSNVTATATSLPVATIEGDATRTGFARWTTQAGDFPFDVSVGGEQITVTNVTNKSVSFVAAGTAATGNNASLVPALPAGIQGGDALLLFASIRNSGTGTVNTPTGYTLLCDMGNAALFGKYAGGTYASAASESAPTVSFSGGASGEDTIAQIAAFRGTSIAVETSATQLNTSAQNIAYPDVDVEHLNCVVLYLGWKQDDWTSVATISGGAEIGEPVSIAGNDAGLVWDYVIQTTAAGIDAGSFTVTGGGSALLRGAVVARRTDVQTMTVTRSINTVVKAQTGGAAVSLYQPGVTALGNF
jgi:hypothetical protein